MRNTLTTLLAMLPFLLSCGDSPSGPPVNPGPTPSELAAEFTGSWTPPDTTFSLASAPILQPVPLALHWSVAVSWTECPDADFQYYRLFRSETPGISENLSSADRLGTWEVPGDTLFVDTLLGEWDRTYYYALRTRDTDSMDVWSNEVIVVVPPETAFGGPDELMETVAVGGQPVSMLAVGSQVWVACFWSDAVYVIETGLLPEVVGVIPVGDGPVDLCREASGERVFVSCRLGNRVDVIRTSDLTVIVEIPVSGSPGGICCTETGRIAVACYGSDRLLAIDSESLEAVDSVTVGDGPWDICAPAGTEEIYVADRIGGTVSVVDANEWSVMESLDVGQEPWVLCADPSGSRVYVGDLSGERVWTVETGSHGVGTGFEVAGGPSGLLALSNGNLIYVSSYYGNCVEVRDPVTFEMLSHFDDGIRPMGLAEAAGGQYVYAANSAVGTVSVYGYE